MNVRACACVSVCNGRDVAVTLSQFSIPCVDKSYGCSYLRGGARRFSLGDRSVVECGEASQKLMSSK